MPRLEMRTGKHAGKTFELSKAVILGRGDNVGIRVHDIKASREHCRVFIQAGKWVVVDLNSRNGITVNGAKTTRKELVSGDQIAIGETVMAYVDENAAAKPKAAPKQAEHMPGEIVVDEVDLGGDEATPSRPAPAQRQAQQSATSSKARSAKDAAFAAARADASRGGKKPAGRGGSSGNDVGLNVSDNVLQFSKVDANKTSALSMDLSQYPIVIQIVIVGGGLLAIGAGIWLLFKALGVTAG